MKIFLFRHGDIENPDQVVYGRLPGFHLSNNGKEQVELSAKSLKNQNIVSIYSSPLERTLESAKIIANVIGLDSDKIEISQEVIEVESAAWQGKSNEDFEKNSEYIKNPLITSDMEGMKDSGKRVYDFLKMVSVNNKNAVVVSHGDPIMGAIGYVTGEWNKLDENYIQKGKYFTIEIIGDDWKVDF